jgi:hypothetical protein
MGTSLSWEAITCNESRFPSRVIFLVLLDKVTGLNSCLLSHLLWVIIAQQEPTHILLLMELSEERLAIFKDRVVSTISKTNSKFAVDSPSPEIAKTRIIGLEWWKIITTVIHNDEHRNELKLANNCLTNLINLY